MSEVEDVCKGWLNEVVSRCSFGSRDLWLSITLSWAYDRRYAAIVARAQRLGTLTSDAFEDSGIARGRAKAVIRDRVNRAIRESLRERPAL